MSYEEEVKLNHEEELEYRDGLTLDTAVYIAQKADKEIAELKDEFRCHELDYQVQIHELKAHCERLREFLTPDYADDLTPSVLNETPAQSLKEIQADAVEEAVNSHIEDFMIDKTTLPLHAYMIGYANKLRGGE